MRRAFIISLLVVGSLGGCGSGGQTAANREAREEMTSREMRSQVVSAVALVEEYLLRDARGEFMETSQWLADVTTFFLPGYDAMTIIRDYEIIGSEAAGDTSRVTVRYEVVGGMVAGEDGPWWSFTDSAEVQMFVVANTEQGLRLAGPALNPHVAGAVVLERSLVDSTSRRRLREALGQGQGSLETR